ncbi:MAG: DUF362 domain-containing protein [Clostridia bacterium]|nr:DUF362 domain-containing protein [Clostridia bacterium]
MASRVYFTREITPEAALRLYELLEIGLDGRVAVKVHSGEIGNQNFIRPEFWRPLVERVGGTVVECNTAYDGARNTTERHKKCFERHGWAGMYDFEILDERGPDLVLEIPNGRVIKKNFVGSALTSYDSLLVLSHFKGHPMGGYGGALKQISIGLASSYGKKYIHGAGDPELFWDSDHDDFLRSMADAASSVAGMFEGKIAYINVMKNMSVDCDCCAVAEDPCMADIGILASTDPVAIDKACLDLVYASTDPGRAALIERIESRNGILTATASASLGVGSLEYELVEV